MKKYFFIIILLFIITGCEKDPDVVTTQDNLADITLTLENLPIISDTSRYVVWLYFSEASQIKPLKVQVLNITGGNTSITLTADLYYLRRAQNVILTVESANESADSLPGIKILAGEVIANTGQIDINNPLSFNLVPGEITASYTLFTPTDTLDNSPKSGIWFVKYNNGNMTQGLELPPLPGGWRYEGWVEVDGKLISTGAFTSGTGADLSSAYSGTHAQVAFPGEDFLNNAPAGVTFPLDLSGKKVYISIASVRNFFNPSDIKVFTALVPADAQPFTTYNMQLNQVLPKGNFIIDVTL